LDGVRLIGFTACFHGTVYITAWIQIDGAGLALSAFGS
jgi:hypothetical protein